MSRHDNRAYQLHMRDHTREALDIAKGRRRSDLDADRTLRYALLHLVCIVGEAATRVSEEERMLHPAIPWRSIIATRNRLIHGYDSIDADTLWTTVELDLPRLLRELERALEA